MRAPLAPVHAFKCLTGHKPVCFAAAPRPVLLLARHFCGAICQDKCGLHGKRLQGLWIQDGRQVHGGRLLRALVASL